jgi:alkylhydroperoxidase family enzyme
MTSRPEIVKPGESDDSEVNKLLHEAEEGWYGDAAFFGAMAHTPVLFTRLYDTLDAFPSGESITPELLELMRLRIATVHECAYCATVRTIDVRDEVADREGAVLSDEIDSDQLTHREELAVTLADYFTSNPHRITDEFVDALREAFGDAETVELLLFTSLEVGLDRFCIALELDTTDASSYPSDLDYPHET